jgi:hypothetical protein
MNRVRLRPHRSIELNRLEGRLREGVRISGPNNESNGDSHDSLIVPSMLDCEHAP